MNEPTCDWCGGHEDVRIEIEGYGGTPPSLTCRGCFTPTDTGPDFDDLEEAEVWPSHNVTQPYPRQRNPLTRAKKPRIIIPCAIKTIRSHF